MLDKLHDVQSKEYCEAGVLNPTTSHAAHLNAKGKPSTLTYISNMMFRVTRGRTLKP